MNWRCFNYLRFGTAKQQQAFVAISESGIIEKLRAYDPAIVSTICIDIDVDSSDIDIICQHQDAKEFRDTISACFSTHQKFKWLQSSSSSSAVVAEFELGGLMFEVYGDTLPVSSQNAYKHLSVMAKLLDHAGAQLRSDVRSLKSQGIKSEAAFCKCLRIEGDPYIVILEFETLSHEKLKDLIQGAGYEFIDVTIRFLISEDAQTIENAFSQIGWNKPAEQYKKYFEEQEQGLRLILVALLKDEFTGYITLNYRPEYPSFQSSGILEIQDLNVLPHFRNRGMASRLLDIAESYALHKSSVIGIGVGLHPGYNAAQRLYVKRGYIPDGRGVTYKCQYILEGQVVPFDDDVVLWMTKSTNNDELFRVCEDVNFFANAAQAFETHTHKLHTLLPHAEIEHIGSTAIPGSVTKADLDILILVTADFFEATDKTLSMHYQRNLESDRNSSFSSFILPNSEPPLGIQLVVKASEYDNFLQFRNTLRKNVDLVEKYNQLKRLHNGKPMKEYRQEKNSFIESVLKVVEE